MQQKGTAKRNIAGGRGQRCVERGQSTKVRGKGAINKGVWKGGNQHDDAQTRT